MQHTPQHPSHHAAPRQRRVRALTAACAVAVAFASATFTAPTANAIPTVGVAALAAGDFHTLIIATNGAAYATGNNDNGQLADPTTPQRFSYAPMRGLPPGVTARAVAGGTSHSVVLGSDAKVYTAGGNTGGQLCDGTTTDRPTLVAATGLPAGVSATAIAAGGSTTLVIGADNKVYGCGDNTVGQLGDDTTASPQRSLVAMTGLPAGVTPTAVATGQFHSLVLGSDGKVYGAGSNEYGQLGNGATSTSPQPTLTALGGIPAGVRVTNIAAGLHHSVALGRNGIAYAAGDNASGQLGDATTAPRLTLTAMGGLPLGVTVRAIAAGSANTAVIGSDANAYATGANSNNQIGDGTATMRTSLTPMRGLPTGSGVTGVSAGHANIHLLTTAGTTAGAGFGTLGQFGTTAQSTTLVTAEAVRDLCGFAESCAYRFGSPGDIAAPADFNANGTADFAVFRAGRWFWDTNRDGQADGSVSFGSPGDLAFAADANGDRAADLVVFRPTTGTWYVDTNRDGAPDIVRRFASPGDIPFLGDFNSDGQADLGVFRPSDGNWYIDTNVDGIGDIVEHYGSPGDMPAPADYDHNGTVDFAVFRPRNGCYFINDGHAHSGTTGTLANGIATTVIAFASPGDQLAAADYEGTARTQLGVFRAAVGTWFVRTPAWNVPRGDEATACR